MRSGSLRAHLHQRFFLFPINHTSLLSVQMLGALEGGTEGSRVGGSDEAVGGLLDMVGANDGSSGQD